MVCSHFPTPISMSIQRPIKIIQGCGGVHTSPTQTPTQIPIGFSANFQYLCLGLGLGVGVGKCEHTIEGLFTRSISVDAATMLQ